MKLLFKIDQRRALSLGLSAPHSTAIIDIDPVLIPPSTRAKLARMVSPGGFRVNGLSLLPGAGLAEIVAAIENLEQSK